MINDEKSIPCTETVASNPTAHIPYGIPCVRELLRSVNKGIINDYQSGLWKFKLQELKACFLIKSSIKIKSNKLNQQVSHSISNQSWGEIAVELFKQKSGEVFLLSQNPHLWHTFLADCLVIANFLEL